MINGKERLYYGDRTKMIIEKEYDKNGDYELLKGDKYSFIDYVKMQGVEFLTNEVHMGAGSVCESQKIIKCIVKIKI